MLGDYSMHDSNTLIVHHAAPAETTLNALDASPKGLSQDEAELRLQKFGANRLPTRRDEAPSFGFWRISTMC